MKIPIVTSERKLNKYNRLLFEYLQRDKEFEELIIQARMRIGLSISLEKEEGQLDVVIEPRVRLRSELQATNIYGTRSFVETPLTPILFEEVEKIVYQYTFLQGFREGIKKFICGDRFLISDEIEPKLKVDNRRFLNLGRYRDDLSEDGVKIVITSKTSKEELKNWIGKNWKIINYFLKGLPNYLPISTRKANEDRDRLIVYLRSKWKMSWGDVVRVIKSLGKISTTGDYKSDLDTLQKAYKDFPLK